MSSYNCCISQKPPSPDGFPSRPVKLSMKPIPIASWSTVSRLSKPEDVAQLRALFESDKSDVVDYDETRFITLKTSVSTLEIVKSKLRKHLSRESAVSKHQPRSTIGNSDEEVQQRKELRLIRQKRINEELSSEAAYDDDAKSLSSVSLENSPSKNQWPAIRSKDMKSSELMKAVPSMTLLRRRSTDGLCTRDWWPLEPIQRRHSFAAFDPPRLFTKTSGWDMRSGSPGLSLPPSPILKPQKLPSITDTATRRTSWRLSFSSDQRATKLRALSHDYELPQLAASSATHDPLTGPLRWFRGQVTRGSLFATADDPHRLKPADSSPTHAVRSPELEEYQGVDGNVETLTAPVSLHHMRISQRLASQGLCSHTSSPQLSSWGSQLHYRDQSYNSQSSYPKVTDESKHHQNGSNSRASTSKHSMCWRADGISSKNNSTEKFGKPASEIFGFSVPSLLAEHKRQVSSPGAESQENSIVSCPRPFHSLTFSRTESKLLFDSLAGWRAAQGRRDAKNSSTLASETLSFLDRDAELAMIETRFPMAMEESRQEYPVQSKFNEDFSGQQIPLLTASREEQSLSTHSSPHRLAKLVSRSYDGASLSELQIPDQQGFEYTFSKGNHSTASAMSPKARSPETKISSSSVRDSSQSHYDDAEEIWAEALKRTQEEYESQLISESLGKKDLNGRHGSLLAIRSVSRKLKGKGTGSTDTSKSTGGEALPTKVRDFDLERELRQQAHKAETERSDANEWADELEARERQAKAKTVAVGRQSPPRVRMLPESWARFPSHTREERTASAGSPDRISSKDFAIQPDTNGIVEWMLSGRKYYHYHDEREQHHSLPVRLSKRIRASLYKLRTKKSAAMSDVIRGRKGSVSVGGQLEFPELEILAGEIAGEGLYEAVEREVEESMRSQEMDTRTVTSRVGAVDGEANAEEKMAFQMPKISIADPRFYEDCVTLPPEEGNEIGDIMLTSSTTVLAVENTEQPTSANTVVIKEEKRRAPISMDRAAKALTNDTDLRRSTLNFQRELEIMEGLERDRAIRTAEEAWGESVA